MTTIKHQRGLANPEPLEYQKQELQLEAAPGLARAQAAGTGYIRPYGGFDSSSRLPAPLPAGAWKLAWKAELDPAFTPAFVLAGGKHVAVQSDGAWQAFNAEGHATGEGRFVFGYTSLDERLGLLYAPKQSGFLGAYNLADGLERFTMPMAYGSKFTRPLIARQGGTFVFVGVQLPSMGGKGPKPDTTVIEVREVAQPIAIEDGMLRLSRVESLIVTARKIVAAMSPGTIHFAVPGELVSAGLDLKIKGAYGDLFDPLVMSADEAGNVYMVVDVAPERHLWIIGPGGKQFARTEIKEEHKAVIQPPVIDYSHRVYLVTASTIGAYSLDGKLLWESIPGGRIAGATVTADDQLLVSTSLGVVAVRGADSSHPVVKMDGDSPLTPPVLTTEGRLLVAGRKTLYCYVQ
jgi:hypothetical protein